MFVRYPLLCLVIAAIALTGCASKTPATTAAEPPRPDGTGTVEVTIDGFDNDEGQALVALFLDDTGWPDDEAQAFGASVFPIENLRVVAQFKDVPAGPFAISVFHDKDSDRELDTGVFGIPTEAYGFSRDARDTFGPPSFDEARLDVVAGESKKISILVD